MRILWVKAGKLLPVDSGGKVRSYNILKHLARVHEVRLLSYYGGQHDPAYEEDIKKEFPDGQTVFTSVPDGTTFEQSVQYLRRLFYAAPFAVSKFTHPKVKRAVAKWFAEERIDVAVCDFLSASQNFPRRLSTPAVLFEHNVETELWQRMTSTEPNLLRRIAYQIEAAKMDRLERYALGHFHHVIAVSEHDRKQLLQMNSSSAISVVPTGVDTAKCAVAPPAPSTPAKIIFTGSMDWEPNIDAVSYFCEEIFPRVRSGFPDAIFQIVGRNPHPKVKRLASESVQVTGTVFSVSEYLRDATVAVVPLRIGGGTRLKIFEAMAMGKAMVSTSIGAEGLDVLNERDIFLADTPPAFADAILLLLRDQAVRRRLEEAAVRLARQHDWSRITQHFSDVLQTAVRSFKARSELKECGLVNL